MGPKKAKKTKKQLEEERGKLKDERVILIRIQPKWRRSAFVRKSSRRNSVRKPRLAVSKKKLVSRPKKRSVLPKN